MRDMDSERKTWRNLHVAHLVQSESNSNQWSKWAGIQEASPPKFQSPCKKILSGEPWTSHVPLCETVRTVWWLSSPLRCKMGKALPSPEKVTIFDHPGLVSINSFLYSFRLGCDTSSVDERAALWFFQSSWGTKRPPSRGQRSFKVKIHCKSCRWRCAPFNVPWGNQMDLEDICYSWCDSWCRHEVYETHANHEKNSDWVQPVFSLIILRWERVYE